MNALPHVGARELKTRLGTYLRQVRDGATLIITERGRPVAELRPITLDEGGLEEALKSLVVRGVLGGEVRERPALADFEPIAISGPCISETILEDREDRF
ncbi:MAG: type II toxin-antitoxin system prevent-host-death family antitoxin [Acidobacteriota bacterium]